MDPGLEEEPSVAERPGPIFERGQHLARHASTPERRVHEHALELADPRVIATETAAADGPLLEPGNDERARRRRKVVGGQTIRVGVGKPVPLHELRAERAHQRLDDGRIESVVLDPGSGQPRR